MIFYKSLSVAAIMLFVLVIVSPLMALPTQQEIPCLGEEGCPEQVNPEPDEYYSVQCTTNAIWVWRTTPIVALVTFVTVFQVGALNEGGSLVASGNVTITRSGDTITLSGDNGNLAPQPGEKSFSWNECMEHNGGLPELLPIGQELTDEQIECWNLDDEQERVDCLNALEPPPPTPNAQPCDDPVYRNTHVRECTMVSCPGDSDLLVTNLDDCPELDATDLFILFIRDLIEFFCGPPVEASAIIFAFVIFTIRRKRK
jgi:hypothetical protein